MASLPVTDPALDFPAWYQDVLAKADLAENGPVRGTMIIRPYGYAIWERIQASLDQRIKRAGAENVYLPLFIPESHLHREAEHVAGFSPELAVVTHAGGKELTEPLIVRPTSETLFGELIARSIQSYRDLPVLLNQWANVVRWEMRPRLFLRSSEFLWQEGHTAHESAADAAAYTRQIHHDVYRSFHYSVLAIPVYVGLKTAAERFAGAVNTLTCEGLMRDGKALQLATSHELGQNFARAFDITYNDAADQPQLAWTTSWGASTRLLGGLIMGHGDAHGLQVPPALAPTQAVIVVARDDTAVHDHATSLTHALNNTGVRAKTDAATHIGFGRRVTDWELKGVPIRIDLGPRDLAAGHATIVIRPNREQVEVPLDDIPRVVHDLLETVQATMLQTATDHRDKMTPDVTNATEAADAAQTGAARIPWQALGTDGERELLKHGVSVRCLQRSDGSIPDSADEAELQAIVARAY